MPGNRKRIASRRRAGAERSRPPPGHAINLKRPARGLGPRRRRLERPQASPGAAAALAAASHGWHRARESAGKLRDCRARVASESDTAASRRAVDLRRLHPSPATRATVRSPGAPGELSGLPESLAAVRRAQRALSGVQDDDVEALAGLFSAPRDSQD